MLYIILYNRWCCSRPTGKEFLSYTRLSVCHFVCEVDSIQHRTGQFHRWQLNCFLRWLVQATVSATTCCCCVIHKSRMWMRLSRGAPSGVLQGHESAWSWSQNVVVCLLGWGWGIVLLVWELPGVGEGFKFNPLVYVYRLTFEWKFVLNFNPCAKFQTLWHLTHQFFLTNFHADVACMCVCMCW